MKGFGTHTGHHQRALSACVTHFALRPAGRGESGRGCGFFGLTEEAVLLTSDPQRGEVPGFSALPGTQCVPRKRLPVRYSNKTRQAANQGADQGSGESGCRRHGYDITTFQKTEVNGVRVIFMNLMLLKVL